MRKTTIAALVALLALAGALVTPASIAAASVAKVVVIVGPVGSMTASYESDADAIAAEALRYTPNVVRIYTPNATWSAVKSALQDANVVVYLGHGNGFPSPYRTTPWPLTQNGLGLNPVAGGGDTTVQYYGESYLASEVRLAPNALVLLHHLCYASGNSEPGRGEPTLAVAQQRVDNYGAGFLAAGARAVIADAHYGSAYYMTALFTTDQTLDAAWRGAPAARGNYIPFQSSRTPGALGQLDPDAPTSGYYRSFVGDPSLTTSAITGGSAVVAGASFSAPPASTQPASPQPAPAQPTFVVPGAASVGAAGGGLYADAALSPDPATGGPSVVLASGTPVRLQAAAGTGPDGSTVYLVTTLDGGRSGYMAATALVSPGGAAPRILALSDGGSAFSPNGDGRADTFQVAGTLSEDATWNVSFTSSAGAILALSTGFGRTFGATWDGLTNGAAVPDGSYRYIVTAADQWGDPPAMRRGTVRIDTTPPLLAPAAVTSLAPGTFSPNGDGIADSLSTALTSTEAGYADVTIASSFGQRLRAFSAPIRAGASSVTWDGRSDAGPVVPDGVYLMTIAPRDAAGNVGPTLTRQVSVYTAVSAVRTSPAVFFPGDANASAPATATLSLVLATPATVGWTISDAAGRTIVTHYSDAPLAPGVYSFAWDGRDATGALVAPGTYYSNVRATDGTLALRTRGPFTVGAFSIVSSVASPARGQSITVTAVSAEPLGAPPVLAIAQPGAAVRTVAMRPYGAGYRVTVTLLRTALPGTATLTVTGVDTAGVSSTAAVALRIR